MKLRSSIERLLKKDKFPCNNEDMLKYLSEDAVKKYSPYDKDKLNAVLEDVMPMVEKKSNEGVYIYRGEPECYSEVSSTPSFSAFPD